MISLFALKTYAEYLEIRQTGAITAKCTLSREELKFVCVCIDVYRLTHTFIRHLIVRFHRELGLVT